MKVRRVLLGMGVVAVAVAGCGDDGKSSARDAAPEPTSLTAGSETPRTSVTLDVSSSAQQLFATVDAAIAQESSVRQDMGNLNPPPPTVLRQEYGNGDDFILEMDVHLDLISFARVNGDYYGRASSKDPWQKAPGALAPDDTSGLAVTARSDVREDFRRMAAMARELEYLGDERLADQPVHHFRLKLNLAAMKNPAIVPALVEGPKPADLWVTPGGLPVRVDVRYSEPLAGTPGTGVSRTDYSDWSEPVDPEVG